MENCYYYLDIQTQEIDKNKFLVIYVYSSKAHCVSKIYKRYSEELEDKLADYELFEEITDQITFAIKSSGKVGLDIKI